MEIADKSHDEDLSEENFASIVSQDGTARQASVEIPVEHVVNVTVNDIPTMVLTCTPGNIIELVLGRLFTEGFIDDIDDVASISLCEHSEHAQVALEDDRSPFVVQDTEEVSTCCTDTKNLARRRRMPRIPKNLGKALIDSEQIFCMAQVFADDTPLHTSTLGVHSCSLFQGTNKLYTFEDLGRHNAFDKAVGAALIDGVDMETLAVLSSGRIPVDMITKAIRSRIPLLVTKATPTTHSISIAREHGLALVGRARPDSYCIFSGEATLG